MSDTKRPEDMPKPDFIPMSDVPRTAGRVEAELAIERLMDKTEAWILQQPEALLIWAQDRRVRKEAAKVIADLFTRIPTRDQPEMNRSAKRRLIKTLEAQDRNWFKGIKF